MTLLCTITMQNVACPVTIVQKPGCMPPSLNADSSAMPVMMPGSAIGSTNSSVTDSRPRKRLFASANAASVPRTIAMQVATDATESDIRSAAQMSSRANATENQCSVRPGGGNW